MRPEAEVAQGALEQDDERDRQRRLHHDDVEDVAKQVAPQDPRTGAAVGLRGQYELALAQLEHLSTHEPCGRHPRGESDEQHQLERPGAEERDQQQEQHELRDRHEHVDHAHERPVPGAQVSGDEADRDPD